MTSVSHPFALSLSKGFDRLSPNGMVSQFLETSIIKKGHAMNQTFNVKGMTCGHCEKAVTRAILALDPQAEVKIDRCSDKVEVQSRQPREALVRAISEEGYAVAA